MRSFWSEPYLWIHLAGIAALPIFLGLCLLGLAVGAPLFPVWLELFLVAAIGILPVLWMQWFRPFYIFSVLFVAIRPEKLQPLQQRLLSQFKTQRTRILSLIGPVLLSLILWQIYQLAPLATDFAPFPPQWRLAGLLLAAVAFLASNLFLQVPISVLGVLFTSEAVWNSVEPYSTEKIRQEFTILGWPVGQILPLPSSEVTN